MLTYLLAWAVAFGSFGLYLTAFFFPELHRKNDLILSGVGLFFALTLWIYADRLRGGLLLGETAAVVLIFWFAWQSFQYRQQLTDPKLKTDDSKVAELWQAIKSVLPGQKTETDGVPSSKVAIQISDWISNVDLDKLKSQFQGVLKKVPLPANKPAIPTETKPNQPELVSDEPGLEEVVEDVAETVTIAVEETITTVVAQDNQILVETETTTLEIHQTEPEPESISEPVVEAITAEPEPTPEPVVEPVAIEPEPAPEPVIEAIATEPMPTPETEAQLPQVHPEVATEPNGEQSDSTEPVPNEPSQPPSSEQESENFSHEEHHQDSQDWPPPGTEVGSEPVHEEIHPHSN